MPTAARLAAAIAFAIVGYFIYTSMLVVYGDDTVPKFLMPLCICAGIWAGWVLCGAHASGIVSGIGTGYTAVIAQVFWIALILSFVQMIELALRRRYDGPVEAVVDVFSIMFTNGMKFGTPQMFMIIAVGGVAGGIFAGIMGKKYPRL